MDAPDIFRHIDPSGISRSKAEETLLYVRYLLKREEEPAKIRVYESLKAILEARLEELTEREILPPLPQQKRNISTQTDLSLEEPPPA
jgi:uncharacterized membrane protein YcjF (UPF0283 family)